MALFRGIETNHEKGASRIFAFSKAKKKILAIWFAAVKNFNGREFCYRISEENTCLLTTRIVARQLKREALLYISASKFTIKHSFYQAAFKKLDDIND